jgi:hypothetical protein
MNLLRRRLADRCCDVLDWIDYRPDANFWALFAVPPMLSVAWAYGGFIGLGVLLGAVLLLTAAFILFAGVALVGWIALHAAHDVALAWFASHGERAASTPRSMTTAR